MPSLSTGIMCAAQGTYTTTQLLLDITQGARVSTSAYSPAASARRSRCEQAARAPWSKAGRPRCGARTARRRSSNPGCSPRRSPAAPATRASPEPGERPGRDRGGRPRRSDRGALARLGGDAARAHRRARQHAGSWSSPTCPAGASGLSDLRALSAARPPDELLIVVQRAPDAPGNELLWAAVGGLRAEGDELSSQSTNERGLIASIDLAPTILRHLGLARSGRDARQADRARRLLRRRLPALVQSAPARDRRPAPAGAGSACSAPGRC